MLFFYIYIFTAFLSRQWG